MALTYQANNKTWSYTPEKTDYQTDRPVTKTSGVLTITPETTFDSAFSSLGLNAINLGLWGILNLDQLIKDTVPALQTNQRLNNEGTALNRQNTAKNNLHASVQSIANATKQGSYNYLQAKQAIQDQKVNLINAGFSDDDAQKTIDNIIGPVGQFRNFYLNEQVQPWDPNVLPNALSSVTRQRTDLGENFNTYKDGSSGYYVNETPQGQDAKKRWDAAVAQDNLDIIARYGSLEAYAKQDYLNQITDPTRSAADIAAIRGSQAAALSPLVTDYREQVFPDAAAQQTRDKVQNEILGLKPVTDTTGKTTGYQFRDIQGELSNFISSDKTANDLWQQAKNEASLAKITGATTPGPWTRLTKSLNVNNTFLTDPELFGSLLSRTAILNPSDSADKNIIDANKNLVDSIQSLKQNSTFKSIVNYAPAVNDAFTKSVQDSEAAQTKRFGELRQSVLQDTINALTDAKRQETNLAFFKSSSVGQEISSLQQDIKNTMLGDIGIGGLFSPASSNAMQSKFDLGLQDVFGTKNGLIYNWEDWFNKTIEKKYAGNIDIPNDYVPPSLRTQTNGFIDDQTLKQWKQYDNAYAALKLNPLDASAKAVIASVPTNYVSVDNRKTVKQEWLDYEQQLKTAGYVDPKTVASWATYDKAYNDLKTDPNNVNAKAIYNQRPADYVPPENRMDKDVQFAKDFFSYYLKPRFDASQSIAEFEDYINVTKDTQNPFQTQDRMNALKLSAQTSVSNWFTSLQKAGDSRFNSDYYFDPVGYLKQNGVGDPNNPLLPGAAFLDYVNTAAGQDAIQQSARVNSDWEAAKKGQTTTDDYGKTIDWAQQAYRYGIDVNNKQAFAQLHYQLVGLNAPQKDASGNIVRDSNGSPVLKSFDAAPDVYGPEVAKLYITQILTPFLIDQSNKIGTVFGQFVKPSDYVDEVLKSLNLPQNKSQWNTILQNYGIDPNASLTEIRNTLVDSLSQDSTTGIKKRIGDFITKNQGKLPTQFDIGVEYIQRAAASGTTEQPSGVYAIFKNAGFSGSEQDFYSTFMPDASKEDINLINAAYTTSGKPTPLLPTITGTGMEQIASMAQLFGDTGITEILGTAGIQPTTQVKPSIFAQFITPSGEDIGITDPFATTSTTFGTVSGVTSSGEGIGIGNPFDDIGITDPFNDPTDPFSSSLVPFAKTSSSVVNPKIVSSAGLLSSSSLTKSSNSFASDMFASFGGF